VGGDGPTTRLALWAAWSPISFLVAFSVDFFFSRSPISWKNDMAKRIGPFDVWKVPTSKKYAKTSKSASQC
jgi:hypothetical protein